MGAFVRVSVSLAALWGLVDIGAMTSSRSSLTGTYTAFMRWILETVPTLETLGKDDKWLFVAESMLLVRHLVLAYIMSRQTQSSLRWSMQPSSETDGEALALLCASLRDTGLSLTFRGLVQSLSSEYSLQTSEESSSDSVTVGSTVDSSPGPVPRQRRWFGRLWRNRRASPTKVYFGVSITESPMLACAPAEQLMDDADGGWAARGGGSVPRLFEVCWRRLMDDEALMAEGLFRIPGNSLVVQKLRAQVEAEGPELHSLQAECHEIASLFKMYLRELPEPLIPYDMYETMVSLQTAFNKGEYVLPRQNSSEHSPAAATRDAHVRAIAVCLCHLPPLNQRVVRRLLLLLNTVHNNARVNRMQSSNLAVCFAPDILRSDSENLESVVTDLPLTTQLLTFMIDNYGEVEDVLGIWETESIPPPASSMERGDSDQGRKKEKPKLEKEGSWKSKLGIGKRSKE
eukprot:c18654_g1_i3.p1 GENE.c18654_g1_i3~~c18654_g1_i3.p1  ORF type:complete len:458 (+),score=88.84 c18654_g1_i3:1347-2720(+)